MSPGGIYTRDCESCDAAFETRFSRRSHCWKCLDATTPTPNPRRKGVMETVVEELRRELLLARDAVAKGDEHAARFRLKQAHAYAIRIPGFIEHATADTDATPEVRRLRDALDGALVCPREDRGGFITQALDAVNEVINADAGGGNDEIVDDYYGRH